MKYRLELSGRGRECYLHKVTDDQWNTLWALYKEHGHSFDELDNADVLGKSGLGSSYEDIQDKAFKTITGPFVALGEFQLVVRNQAGEAIFDSVDLEADTLQEVLDSGSSSGDAPCPTASWVGSGHDEELWICATEMIKGGFWTAGIETEGEFDPSKLKLDFMMVVEDRIHLVTDASYDGQKLQPEWLDDYTSRGLGLDINYPPSKWGQ